MLTMEKRMKKGKFINLLLVGIIFSSIFVSMVFAIPNYDPKILESFENGVEWVEIKVDLNDYSNITLTGTKEEKKEAIKQIDDWFKLVINEVLNTFSETEMKLSKKTLRGFRGEITKEGFNKLIKDMRVKAVYFGSIPVSAILDDNKTIMREDMIEEIEVKEGNLLWLWILLLMVVITISYLIIKKSKKQKKRNK